jgi:hypothetical protein
MLYRQNKLQEYHSYCSKESDHFSNVQKLQMLQNAVYPVNDLRQICVNADITFTNTKKHLSYNQYSQLLLSLADSHDSNLGNNNNKYNNWKQSVYNITSDSYFEDDKNNGIKDNNNELLNVDIYLSHVTSINKPIQTKQNYIPNAVGNNSGSNYNNSNNNRRNFIPAEAMARIP